MSSENADYYDLSGQDYMPILKEIRDLLKCLVDNTKVDEEPEPSVLIHPSMGACPKCNSLDVEMNGNFPNHVMKCLNDQCDVDYWIDPQNEQAR